MRIEPALVPLGWGWAWSKGTAGGPAGDRAPARVRVARRRFMKASMLRKWEAEPRRVESVSQPRPRPRRRYQMYASAPLVNPGRMRGRTKMKATPHEAARAVGIMRKAESMPGAGVQQGGARKEKAAHEGRPEFRTFCSTGPG